MNLDSDTLILSDESYVRSCVTNHDSNTYLLRCVMNRDSDTYVICWVINLSRKDLSDSMSEVSNRVHSLTTLSLIVVAAWNRT